MSENNGNIKIQTFIAMLGIFVTIEIVIFGFLWAGINNVQEDINGKDGLRERITRTEANVGSLIEQINEKKRKTGDSSFNLLNLIGIKR